MSVRGSMPPAPVRSSYGTSRQRPAAAIAGRDGVGAVRRRAAPTRAASAGRAVAATSPTTPRSTGRWAPSASGVEVDLHHRRVRADQRAVPHRPHVQRAAPADDEVGAADQLGGQRRGEAAGDAERPRVAGEQAVRDGRGREQRARRRRPARAAPARRRGRRGRRRTPGAARRRASGPAPRPRRRRGRGGASAGTAGSSAAGAGAAWTSSGRLSTTVRRSLDGRPVRADDVGGGRGGRVHPLGHRADGRGQGVLVDPEVRPPAAAPSAASTSSGVRLLAASVMPVIALVSPQPWCTVSTAGRPAVRAYASAIVAAPPSCRAATNGTPAATSAFVTWKLPLPTTPNAWPTPSRASAARRRASATVGHRSTSASTRAGLPDPATIGSGAGDDDRAGGAAAARGSAAGSARTCPRRAGRSGTGTPGRRSARRRRRCRRSRRRAPMDGRLLGEPPRALDRDAGRVRAGLVGVEERRRRRRCGASQPVR